jgi:hypothetical protein
LFTLPFPCLTFEPLMTLYLTDRTSPEEGQDPEARSLQPRNAQQGDGSARPEGLADSKALLGTLPGAVR